MIFLLLDNTGNGLLDSIEFFTLITVLSNSMIEDRVRFLFDLYDMNRTSLLEEEELHFMLFNAIQGLVKYYQLSTESIDVENSAGQKAFQKL